MRRAVIRNLYRKAVIALFLLLVFAPALGMMYYGSTPFSLTERRLLARFPAAPKSAEELKIYSSQVDDYLNDHFGFRDFLIYRYQREVRKRFAAAGVDSRVHQGIDNWFFFGKEELIFDFAGKLRLAGDDLKAWHDGYNRKRAWLAAQNIKYLLIVPPNKQSVYPEYMMEPWRQVQGVSLLQQLIRAYPEIAGQELLNLGDFLQRRKADEPLYYKSDTHWTSYGAFQAYLAIAGKLAEMFPEAKFRLDFPFSGRLVRRCEKDANRCGDLTGMLLDFEPFEEAYSQLELSGTKPRRLPLGYSFSNLPQLESMPCFATRQQHGDLKALVFRDSFFSALVPFFSENFSEVIYLWKPYDQKNVEELLEYYRPDLVVEEIVERDFVNLLR